MLYKYEDTFINEIQGGGQTKRRHIINEIMIIASVMVLTMVLVYVVGGIVLDKKVGEVYDECKVNLSINNCFVIGANK